MNDYFCPAIIVKQICKERIKLACRRDDEQYLARLMGDEDPVGRPDALDAMLPPRRKWNAFRPRHRLQGSDVNLAALLKCVTVLREQRPELAWVRNLNQVVTTIQQRVFSSDPFVFTKPRVTWLKKSGNEYRALCLFGLEDNVIACLLGQYLRDRVDETFCRSSFAFRARNVEGETPTHHDAFNYLHRLKHSQPETDFYVAESDIRGFFDTVDHDIAFAALERVSQRTTVHARAMQIFRAYLDCYNFRESVLEETEPLLKRHKGDDARFPWPAESLVDLQSRVVGVPQGGSISGLIANLVLDAADKRIEQLRESLGGEIHYLRYCDDIILVSPVKEHCELAFGAYQQVLAELRLPFHSPSTTHIYDRNHWGKTRKSRAVYCWSGRQWFNCVPWVQFVGYQVRYDGLVRTRKGAFTKQAEKFVEWTDEVKFRLLRAGRTTPITASKDQALRSFAHKLMSKGVGRIAPYSFGPRPMSWSSGFKALHEKPIVGQVLRHLDRLRQKQILRFAAAQINYGLSRRRGRRQGWNPKGYLDSYYAQFENVGGKELIDSPWRPSNVKEWVQAKIFAICKTILQISHRLRQKIRKLKKRVRKVFEYQIDVQVGEVWADSRFRDHVYEVLDLGWRVKCRNARTGKLRYLARAQFTLGRYTRLTDRNGRFV